MGTDAFRQFGWLSIADRVRYFAYRIRIGLARIYVGGFVRFLRGSAFDFHILASDIPGVFSLFCKIQWNELPVRWKSIDSEASFKAKLKRF